MARGPEWIDHVDRMRQEMERLMEHFATRKPPAIHFSPHLWEPLVDVVETGEDVVVIVDLAGLTREDIELSVMPDALTLRGERRDAIPPRRSSLSPDGDSSGRVSASHRAPLVRQSRRFNGDD